MAVLIDAFDKSLYCLHSWEMLCMFRKFQFRTDATVDEDENSTLQSGEMSDDAVITAYETPTPQLVR